MEILALHIMRRTVQLVTPLALTLGLAIPLHPSGAGAQDTTRTDHHWRAFAGGFVSSILLHEAGHVGASLVMGARPTFGFVDARPTIYSGINSKIDPHKQFIFSSAGLTVQSVLDEAVLDAPRLHGSAFERGVLAGGIGTTLFYVTVGRWGSVSDVDFMARTRALTKTQVTFIYGSVAVLHTLRISRDGRYANFFMRPRSDGGFLVGLRVADP